MAAIQPFELQNGNKFAFLLINKVHVKFPAGLPMQLNDGTWVLDKYPASPDLHWEKMLGELRFREIQEANLILARIGTGQAHIVTQADEDAGEELAQAYTLLQLSGVIEYNTTNLVIGSVGETAYIRRYSTLEKFHQTKGYLRRPVTVARLEHANDLASAFRSLAPSPTRFGRFSRGLNCLLSGLREVSGQERLHSFVRALEGLIIPETGNTKTQFTHRCQTFAVASPEAKTALANSYDMRSDAEHLHDWDRSLPHAPGENVEDVALWRTRQMEALASFAYDRILTSAALLEHFENDDKLRGFWKFNDSERIKLFGKRLDLSSILIVRKYDGWGRAMLGN